MRTLPNLISLVRPACTLPFVLLCAQVQAHHTLGLCLSAAGLYAVITASDVLDGWLARRLDQEHPVGRMLDHLCDISFILVSLGFFTRRALVPWWVPAAIAWAFVLYMVDSWWRTAHQRQHTLLASRIGHLGGILYYATVGLTTLSLCLDRDGLLGSFLGVWYPGIALVAWSSGAERIWLMVRASTAHRCRRRQDGKACHSADAEA